MKSIVRQEFTSPSGPRAPTLTQLRMLYKIKTGICHVGTLAEACGISQPATSIMATALVRKGYVTRVPLPTDRRQIQLRLTAKATASLTKGFDRAYERLAQRLSPLSVSRQDALAHQIRDIAQLLAVADPQ